MANSVYRRCGCRGQDGKQYGASCPQLKSDAKHGLWAYLLSYGSEPDPSQPGRRRRRQFRKGGYRTKGELRRH
jgi:hypothetical protein